MKQFACFLFLYMLISPAFTQTYNLDSALTALKSQKDSSLRAAMKNDSAKIEKEFADKTKWEKLKGVAQYPAINAGEFSGIIPVADPTEKPDPNIDYKLLFEVTFNNGDTMMKDVNASLMEVSRVINLHVASGIPLKRIMPVIVIHAGALAAISTNECYKKKYKVENPNIKVVDSLKKLGAKFIACGQAMAFFDYKKEDLLPDVKISLTAQTVLSAYQLKGYVLFKP